MRALLNNKYWKKYFYIINQNYWIEWVGEYLKLIG